MLKLKSCLITKPLTHTNFATNNFKEVAIRKNAILAEMLKVLPALVLHQRELYITIPNTKNVYYVISFHGKDGTNALVFYQTCMSILTNKIQTQRLVKLVFD
jgi:hypothetical protein